jgi:hypothetical protein
MLPLNFIWSRAHLLLIWAAHTCRVGAERNNWYRLRRALAILCTAPGRTLRDLDIGMDALTAISGNATAAREAGKGGEEGGELEGHNCAPSSVQRYDFRTFFLFRQRIPLKARVDTRVQEMVRARSVMYHPQQVLATLLLLPSLLGYTLCVPCCANMTNFRHSHCLRSETNA